MTHQLQTLSKLSLHLTWHENRSSYISVRKKGLFLTIRLHRLFYDAPTPVLEAILDFALTHSPRSRAIIRQMAHLYFSQNTLAPLPLNSQGQTYDLQAIFNRLNTLALPNISIGWSPSRPRGRFRSLTFGTYDSSRRQIRISPLLDHPEVPLYFIEFVVYHELLHALIPTEMDSAGRCSIHSQEFKAKELLFPDYKRAKTWERASLQFFRKLYGRP